LLLLPPGKGSPDLAQAIPGSKIASENQKYNCFENIGINDKASFLPNR